MVNRKKNKGGNKAALKAEAKQQRKLSSSSQHNDISPKLRSAIELTALRFLAGVQIEATNQEATNHLFVNLVDGDVELLEFWKTLSKSQKQELIALDNGEKLHELASTSTPSNTDAMLVEEIQAKFLMGMEAGVRLQQDDVTTNPTQSSINNSHASYTLIPLHDSQHNSTFCLAAIVDLKSQLRLAYVKEEIYRKVFLVIVYFAWRLRPNWWMGTLVTSVVLVLLYFRVEEAGKLRGLIRRVCDALFVGRHASSSQWKADSFIAAMLLLNLVSGSTWVGFVIFVALLPYLFEFLESSVAHYTDMQNFAALRRYVSFGNKILLVVFAWSSWSSLFLVCMLFFKELSVVVLQTILGATGMGFYFLFTKVVGLVPEHIRVRAHHTFLGGNRMFVSYAFAMAVLGGFVWFTYEWSFPYGGIARIVLASIALIVFPIQWMLTILTFATGLLLIPLNATEYVLKVCAKFAVTMGIVSKSDNIEAENATEESDNFFDEIMRKQEERRRTEAEEST